ncbi:endonuclease [Marivita hallyeonensis]|uniref:Predicted 5' DNA nuclease, flap endonuclease-1-like, helix-3-turn-helix (H3TH) domain n=1 Tax=Marivita hallyeonensis TaxID=996342 RepID=A0A1M5RIE6_9RHOB|nr:endonuclease [Marivita hallyeonensis]SHH26021.1 Predicted 5' DNA nuclease, flap endonuclease-1-like, helix-3-turn-helix (H3TH) domain [Marivita hallyeonensis]
MQQKNSGMSCQLGSWAMAAGVGLLIFVLLRVLGSTGWMGSIFLGGVAFLVLGLVFSWLFCRDLPEARGPGNIDASNASQTSAPAPKAAAPSAPAPSAPSPQADPAPTASEATSPASATKTAVKASTPLPGQADLASRKGEWKYEGGAAAATSVAAPAAAASTASTPDYDGDGKAEGADEGTKPATLSEAREGGADNLKEIKGVGPKLEKLLNSMGFYHFDQIANWTADEVAWVNANLEGFKGRVTRDNWVEQAKILASGGETEFSKRVDKGGVY